MNILRNLFLIAIISILGVFFMQNSNAESFIITSNNFSNNFLMQPL